MTLKPKNDLRTSAFALALAMALIMSCLMLAMQWRTGTQRAIILSESVNPNNASVASLLRLPGVGPKRAQAIVIYRQSQVAGQSEQAAYTCPIDLQRIKGFGPRIVSALSPWLKFDEPM